MGRAGGGGGSDGVGDATVMGWGRIGERGVVGAFEYLASLVLLFVVLKNKILECGYVDRLDRIEWEREA